MLTATTSTPITVTVDQVPAGTLPGGLGSKVAIAGQNQMVSLQCRGSDVWWLTGALA